MGEVLIEDHGVIGNLRSTALVSVEGEIDFYCFPQFDSPSVFLALLDREKGGSFRIDPEMDSKRIRQMYLPDTNILLTRFLSDDGVAEVMDFMPMGVSSSAGRPLAPLPEKLVHPQSPGKANPPDQLQKQENQAQPSTLEKPDDGEAYVHQIIRIVRVTKGEVRFKMRCAPRFNYARSGHTVAREGDALCFAPDSATGPTTPSMALHGTVPLEIDGQDATADFVLRAGELASFAFGNVPEDAQTRTNLLDPDRVDQQFRETAKFWRTWLGKSKYRGRWREIVDRSALFLKLLCSREYGSLVAAPTFGLPEQIGGSRNWDYRYTWLRDSSFSLYAFMRLGFTEEALEFTHWLRDRIIQNTSKDGPLRVMYAIDGVTDLSEIELDHLSGYKNSKPVRIGNGAAKQLQLDIYGELLDALYLSNKYARAISHDGWNRLKQIMEWLSANWQRPDEGIWEVRGGRQHFLHSRLMCWVAFDRVIRLADKRSLAGPVTEWRQTRDTISEGIFTEYWNEDMQSFVQVKGGRTVDASLLLMPMMRFISPTDPKWLSTLKLIEERLCEDSLVYRYVNVPVPDAPGEKAAPEKPLDGLEGHEGSFTACSFWLIECLARSGQLDKARLLFDKMLGYANHLGLYAEELGSGGEHLGNFPQAFTHLALISAATYLDRKLSGSGPTEWE
jgi:GH15 family glucan-1,4-alpha-glucosidase